MLSILIPTYNYNTYSLVLELKQQADQLGIIYEIQVQDDCSYKIFIENTQINSLSNCNFSINTQNLGRGKNINCLVEKSKFNWLLIMDCDTYPCLKNFIQNYITQIKEGEKVVFGGIKYQNKKPHNAQLLRWIYGTARESIAVEKRLLNPNERALTSNLMLQKEVFLSTKFDESITKYGYEDLVFLSDLKKSGTIVKHIDNPTYHWGLETSQQFLDKTKTALENLKLITKTYHLNDSQSKLLNAFLFLEKLHLTPFVSFLFKKGEKKIEQNLLSQKPSLFLFDLYKLGYYCTL